MIITISGTPGTGKTSIARILAKLMGCKLVAINKFVDEHKLSEGKDKAGSKIVDVAKLKKEMEKHLKKFKDDIIIEGHLAHFLRADFCVVLRCDPMVLDKRLKKKAWRKAKIKENVQAEILDVILAEALANKKIKCLLELDNTMPAPKKCAKKILRLIKKAKPHRENVQWLKKYENMMV